MSRGSQKGKGAWSSLDGACCMSFAALWLPLSLRDRRLGKMLSLG